MIAQPSDTIGRTRWKNGAIGPNSQVTWPVRLTTMLVVYAYISALARIPTARALGVVVNAAPPVAGEITNALGYAPADRAGDHFNGPIDCGPHQTIGGPLENMAKHSENFAAAAWDKNGGSCSVTSNAIIAPDGNQTSDVITAVTSTPVIQQQIAGLTDGGARLPLGPAAWGETRLLLPQDLSAGSYRDPFTGAAVKPRDVGTRPALAMAEVLCAFPVALLEAEA